MRQDDRAPAILVVIMPFGALEFLDLRPLRLTSVLYEVTSRCNLACAHCYNVWKNGVGYSTEELGTEGALRLIAKAVKEGHCEQMTFTGGEPCLREDLETLVSFAKGRVRHVVLITNGTLLDEARIRSLLEAGVDLFELPLHGGDSAIHDEALGCPGSFDRITRTAVDIRRLGGQIAFVFVGKRANIAHWGAALELGVALGARSFLFNRWNAGGACHARPEELMPSVAQIHAALEVAEAGVQRYGVVISASIPLPPCLVDVSPYPNVAFGFCSAGGKHAYFTLDPMGFVRPCNHSATVLGNLLDQPFRRLARSRVLKDFVAARPAFCAGCAQEGICMGGCKAAAEVCSGDLRACEPFLAMNVDRARRPED